MGTRLVEVGSLLGVSRQQLGDQVPRLDIGYLRHLLLLELVGEVVEVVHALGVDVVFIVL